MTTKNLGSATVSGGIARTNYTIPSDELVGDFTLQGTYVQNDHYKEATATADFKVRIGTTITVDNVTGNHGESSNFTAHVLQTGNTPVNDGQVQFKIEGNIIGTANVSNGVATYAYTIPSSVADNSSITANYLGTSTYGTSATSSSGTLHIRSGVTVTVDSTYQSRSGSVDLACIVEDGSGNPITDTSVDFYIDNVKVGTGSVCDGTTHKYSYTYSVPSNAAAGSHTIKCVSAQTSDHTSAEGTGTLTVLMPVTITLDNVSGNIGGQYTYTAHVVDENNAPVTAGKCIFKCNGKNEKDGNNSTIYVNVNSSGVATLTVDVPSNATETGTNSTYTLSAVYSDSSHNYENVSGENSVSATLTIRKTPVLAVNSVTANRGDTVYLTCGVTYNSENVTEGSVSFTLIQT